MYTLIVNEEFYNNIGIHIHDPTLERLTQKILNIDTIKKTSIFPRERDRILP